MSSVDPVRLVLIVLLLLPLSSPPVSAQGDRTNMQELITGTIGPNENISIGITAGSWVVPDDAIGYLSWVFVGELDNDFQIEIWLLDAESGDILEQRRILGVDRTGQNRFLAVGLRDYVFVMNSQASVQNVSYSVQLDISCSCAGKEVLVEGAAIVFQYELEPDETLRIRWDQPENIEYYADLIVGGISPEGNFRILDESGAFEVSDSAYESGYVEYHHDQTPANAYLIFRTDGGLGSIVPHVWEPPPEWVRVPMVLMAIALTLLWVVRPLLNSGPSSGKEDE